MAKSFYRAHVSSEFRRRGVASMLFEKAEEIAAEKGEETVYNYVHPNNERMIGFLRSKGYTVLNLIEIRKPYKGEKPSTTIHVENNEFDYWECLACRRCCCLEISIKVWKSVSGRLASWKRWGIRRKVSEASPDTGERSAGCKWNTAGWEMRTTAWWDFIVYHFSQPQKCLIFCIYEIPTSKRGDFLSYVDFQPFFRQNWWDFLHMQDFLTRAR